MYQHTCQKLREKLENIKALKMTFGNQLASVQSFEQIEKLKIAQEELNLQLRELEKIFLEDNRIVKVLLRENKIVKEFQKQYLDQIKLGVKLALFEEADPVITGIDGKKYPAPKWEDILDTLTFDHLKQIQELKLEDICLLVVPFALPLQKMVIHSSGVIDTDYSTGEGIFSQNSAGDVDKLLYFRHNSREGGMPINKTQILKNHSCLDKFPGWLVSIVGNHRVKITETPGNYQNFFENFDRGNLQGVTLEEAIFLLRKNSVQLNYDLLDTPDGEQLQGDVLVLGNRSKFNDNRSYTLRLKNWNPKPRSFNCPIAIRLF